MNKKLILIATLILVFFVLPAFAVGSPGFMEKWQKQNDLLVSPSFYVNVEEKPILKVVAQTDRPGSVFQVFWLPRYQTKFDFSQSFSRKTSILPGLKTYYFNFKDLPNWNRELSGLLIRIVPEAEAFHLKEVSFVAEEPFLVLSSRWQGFWAIPELTARKINKIQAPFWGDLNFMQVIYLVLLLVFLFVLVFAGIQCFKNKQGFGFLYFRVGMVVIGALIVCWLILDLRFSFDYLREIYYGTRYFASQSIDQKKDFTYQGRISEFAAFCKQALPPGAKINLKGTNDFQQMALAYLLMPIYSLEFDRAEYVVGFGVAKQEIQGFDPYKNLEDKGWILKRRSGYD